MAPCASYRDAVLAIWKRSEAAGVMWGRRPRANAILPGRSATWEEADGRASQITPFLERVVLATYLGTT